MYSKHVVAGASNDLYLKACMYGYNFDPACVEMKAEPGQSDEYSEWLKFGQPVFHFRKVHRFIFCTSRPGSEWDPPGHLSDGYLGTFPRKQSSNCYIRTHGDIVQFIHSLSSSAEKTGPVTEKILGARIILFSDCAGVDTPTPSANVLLTCLQ
jgi:hypothetical protein